MKRKYNRRDINDSWKEAERAYLLAAAPINKVEEMLYE